MAMTLKPYPTEKLYPWRKRVEGMTTADATAHKPNTPQGPDCSDEVKRSLRVPKLMGSIGKINVEQRGESGDVTVLVLDRGRRGGA